MNEPLIDASAFIPLFRVTLLMICMPIGFYIGWQICNVLREIFSQPKEKLEKLKNENRLDRFSVPYDQDTDDEKPKRQTYMTIGDDGELVEMDE